MNELYTLNIFYDSINTDENLNIVIVFEYTFYSKLFNKIG